MFYYLSKLISFFIWPSNVVCMLLLAGAVLMLSGRGGLRAKVWGRRSLLAGLTMLLVGGFSPLGNLMILPLESRFPPEPQPGKVAGIIMLGGFETPDISRARGQMTINEAGERLTESVRLALHHPEARIIFTGGEGRLLGLGAGAAGTVGSYLQDVGIARERIVLEGQSRTTWENAVLLHAMLKPKPGERFLLVTSAFHMPRSIGTFRQAGFDVMPWPVDYRTNGWSDLLRAFPSLPEGLERIDMSFKEWIGLAAYRLSGRSSALWPGPAAAASGPATAPAAPPLPAR